MRFVVSRFEEELVPAIEEMRNDDRATNTCAELVLVIHRLRADILLVSLLTLGVGDGGPWRRKTPGVEDGIADKVRDCAVILIPAWFERVVLKANALILRRESTRNYLNFADGFHRNRIEDRPVVALLADRRERHAVEIFFAQPRLCSADDGGAACWIQLSARKQVGKLRGVGPRSRFTGRSAAGSYDDSPSCSGDAIEANVSMASRRPSAFATSVILPGLVVERMEMRLMPPSTGRSFKRM